MIIFQSDQSDRYWAVIFLHIVIDIKLIKLVQSGCFLSAKQLLDQNFSITIYEIIPLFYYYQFIFFICFRDNSYSLLQIFLIIFDQNFPCYFIWGQLLCLTSEWNKCNEREGCSAYLNLIPPRELFHNFIYQFFGPFYFNLRAQKRLIKHYSI